MLLFLSLVFNNISFDKKESISIGNFNFNIPRRVLYFNKEEKKLSYKESELLKLLYQNRNELIDRRDILNLLCGEMIIFLIAAISMYILPNYLAILKVILLLKYLPLKVLDIVL